MSETLFSLDIETLGLSSKAAVIEVALCGPDGIMFNWLVSPMYYLWEGEECKYEISPDTIDWHNSLHPKYFEFLKLIPNHTTSPYKLCISLAEVIERLREFYGDIKIFANHPQFDITILTHMYEVEGVKVPWKHREILDYATVRWMFRHKLATPELFGKHTAVTDAIAQHKNLLTMLEGVDSHD